jgi:hypothetical protein
VNPQFPLYIVSKGRWESRLTSKALEEMGVPYYVVIEPQEFDQYAAVIDPKKLLILDPKFKEEYDVFNDFGVAGSTGSGPARNFAWDHSVKNGFAWHWVMDDNIDGFYRLNRNLKVPVADGTIFRVMEDFCLRYENISMAGPNYHMFATRKSPRIPPFVTNTRIYSCNLIRNDVPFRWRCRYNEDTDLSLRMLKAGWCTVLFNAFLQYKTTTLKLKGGNTDTIYQMGTLPKSSQLYVAHPDVTRIVWKFGRWHHHVDYSKFKRLKLIQKEGVKVEQKINNYGMILKKIE